MNQFFKASLMTADKRDELFDADKRNSRFGLSIWTKALNLDVGFNKKTQKAEIYGR